MFKPMQAMFNSGHVPFKVTAKCPRCDVPLVQGKAIASNETGALTILPVPLIKSDELELINVLKCPNCGYSRT